MGEDANTSSEKQPVPAQRELLSSAEDAIKKEHDLSFWAGLRLYPKAVCWSMMMSTALIMDGYDFKLMGSLFAQPAFSKAYGQQHDGKYVISAAWQSGLNNGSNIGQMIGLLIAGFFVDHFGFRKSITGALLLAPCFIFLQFFANALPMLEVGQILLGIPLGIFQTVTCVYAIDVMPVALRAYLTSYASGCVLIGQLISAGVLRGTLYMKAPWAYRVPFAIQWFWPLPLLVGTFFAPESPWWLVRQNRITEAKHSVLHLASVGRDPEFDADKTVALIVLTTEHEREANAGVSYVSCFRGTDLRRTLIVIGCYCITVMAGSTVRAYATYFFTQAGLSTDASFDMSIALYAVGVVGLFGAWALMPYFGRRTIFLWGQAIQTIVLLTVGILGAVQHSSSSEAASRLAWGIGGLLTFSSLLANLAIQPILYTIVSELPSSLLRNKSVVLARFSYGILNVIANVITPFQLNPLAWDWGALSGFFWGGACLLGFIFTYFCIPESRGRTIAELDLLFEKGVPARKFARTSVDFREAV